LKWMILRCSRPGFSELGTPAVLGKPRTYTSRTVKFATRAYKFPFWKELPVDAVIEGSVHASFRER
jgi:hypothetical protein